VFGFIAQPERHVLADSDEVARAFRDDVARYSDLMSPGSGASLADNLWQPSGSAVASERLAGDWAGNRGGRYVGTSSFDVLLTRARRRLWPVRSIRCAL
jgi:hypothetical protein